MRYLILILFVGMVNTCMSQTLLGTITDALSGATIPMADICVKRKDSIVYRTQSDFDGSYQINDIKPDQYNIEISYIGYETKYYTDVLISLLKTTKLKVKLYEEMGVLEEVVIQDRTKKSNRKSKTKKSNLAAQTAGVAQSGHGSPLTVRGGRSGKTVYFVNGVKVLGTPHLTNKQERILRVMTGGTPAEYGNQEWSSDYHHKNYGSIGWFKKNKKNEIIIGESYETIIENKFLTTQYNPVSTFSIDVDKASYSNIRRFINNGITPSKNAVRIEEMINYFDYNYPKSMDKMVSHYTELSICPWNKKHHLLHIGLQGKQIKREKRKASNLVFLVDVSGSMDSPNKLPLVKRTLKMVVDKMEENDKISIVVYAGEAGCVLEPTSRDNKIKILEALDNLYSGGSTDGGLGIELAYKLAEDHFIKDGNNRVILATDGDFNVGISSNKGLEDLIAEKRDTHIFLTVLGYGMGNYKDDKLELLADKGNGNYAYIDNFQEAKDFLIKDFNSTIFTLAKDVKLQLEFNPKYVKEYRLIGYENRALEHTDFIDDTKDAGELGEGQSVTALYEIIPVKNQGENSLKYRIYSESSELFNLKIRYKTPTGSVSKELVNAFETPLLSLDKTSDRFRLSASVAMFGLILRNSKYKSDTTNCAKVIKLAKSATSIDKYGYRKEFIRLVRRYRANVNARTAEARYFLEE